ncbi:MAG: MFS transporter [Proteobacteria bacterium]|nr:MFS transporter [Pseudomonadota bacterium]
MTTGLKLPGAPGRSLRLGQLRTLAVLFAGYAACYYCRADLSVATPLLADELGRRGLTHGAALEALGAISSFGVAAYALGKFVLTGLADFWGGRRNFLLGLGGAAVFTFLFALSGALPIFTLAWIGNRLTQAGGWAGLIKVSSRWFDYTSHGAVIGILSISYLVGDALARQQMGMLIGHGYGWRALFVFAGLVVTATFIASLLWLRESRTDEGHAPATANPLNLFAATQTPPAGVRELLRPLLRSGAFLLVCVLSFTCTVIRETFNSWLPQYLHDQSGFDMGRAASLSAIFPAAGAVSVLSVGWLSDRLGLHGRALIMVTGLAVATAALLVMSGVQAGASHALFAVVSIAAVAFFLLGPYSYLGGAFALDFGGKQASAASSGIIDGIGYLGGILAGRAAAGVAADWGWGALFLALAVFCAVAAICAGALCVLNFRAARNRHV